MSPGDRVRIDGERGVYVVKKIEHDRGGEVLVLFGGRHTLTRHVKPERVRAAR